MGRQTLFPGVKGRLGRRNSLAGALGREIQGAPCCVLSWSYPLPEIPSFSSLLGTRSLGAG